MAYLLLATIDCIVHGAGCRIHHLMLEGQVAGGVVAIDHVGVLLRARVLVVF